MNQFIDFGMRLVARQIIRQVILFSDGEAHVELDNGSMIILSNIDKDSIQRQLNPPRSNVPYFTHTGNQ